MSDSPSLIERVVYGVLRCLAQNGGQLRVQELIKKVEPSLALNQHDREITEGGSPRWINVIHYYSIPLAHAGFITKNKGTWFLTDEGAAVEAHGPVGAVSAMRVGERKWKKARAIASAQGVASSEPPASVADSPVVACGEGRLFLDDVESIRSFALEGIRRRICQMNPYEFQDVVAALLRAMGYFTPYVAPRGKDGGVDIIANVDALGISGTRIKVQVKHTPDSSVPASVVQKLVGTLSHPDEVGLVVTSGDFSQDAKSFARGCSRRIGLVAGDGFIDMWEKFYDKLPEEDRALLPLVSVMFLSREVDSSDL